MRSLLTYCLRSVIFCVIYTQAVDICHAHQSHSGDAQYCIMLSFSEQHIISGLKRVVVPFMVVNYDGNFERDLRASVKPENARVSIHAIDTKSSIDDGDIGIAHYEAWIEGAITETDNTVYEVSLTHPRGCAQELSVHKVVSHKNQVLNSKALDVMLDKRLYVGDRFEYPVVLPGLGLIPANDFTIISIINTADTIQSDSYRQHLTLSCIPASLSSLRVKVQWHYQPAGTPYREDVNVYDNQVTSVRYHPPTIDFSKTAESFDLKNLKLVAAGVAIEPPRIDCSVQARNEDVEFNVGFYPPRVGHFSITGLIEPEGMNEYRIKLQLSPSIAAIKEKLKTVKKNAELKFAGDLVELTVRAGVKGKENKVAESYSVSIPEFRTDVERYRDAVPLWSYRLREYSDGYKGKIAVLALDGTQFEALKRKVSRIGNMPTEPAESRDIVKELDLYGDLRRSTGVSSTWNEVRDRLISKYERDSADVDNLNVRKLYEYFLALRQYQSYTVDPLSDKHSALVVLSVGTSKKHGKVLALMARKSSLGEISSETLLSDIGTLYRDKADLTEMATFNENGEKDGNAYEYIVKLIDSGALNDVTAQSAD